MRHVTGDGVRTVKTTPATEICYHPVRLAMSQEASVILLEVNADAVRGALHKWECAVKDVQVVALTGVRANVV